MKHVFLLIFSLSVLAASWAPANESRGSHKAHLPVPEQANREPAAPPGKRSVVKWHPGHYVTLAPFDSDGPDYFDKVLAEIVQYPAMRGVQKRYLWSTLERGEGQYDFSEIEADLARLARHGKRLVILLQTKSFKATAPAAPLYLEADKYEGGSFSIDIPGSAAAGNKAQSGANLKLWNPLVRDRLTALLGALGNRFNKEPYLEAVALTETALGKPVEGLSAAQERRYFDNLLSVNREMGRAFPNTVTLQFVNYPRSILSHFIGAMGEAGIGLGGPDVFPDDPGLLKGAYSYYPRMAGQIPLAPSVQHENYYTRRHRGPREAPEVEELYRFARDDLHANYLFWTRRVVPPEKPYAKVLEFMRSPGFSRDPAGGLNMACPTSFAGCDSN
ncbi:MAG: glycoside hydrolase [Pseudomonadota bacterium]